MKKMLPFIVVPGLLLAASCGVKTDDEDTPTNPSTVDSYIPVEPELLQSADNLLLCKEGSPDQSAQQSPECQTPEVEFDASESDTPDLVDGETRSALITVKYTLKCHEKARSDLSNIAIKTDSQLRRLQYNVENASLSIFDESNPAISLVTLNENSDIFTANQASGCWFFSFEKTKTQYFGQSQEQ